MSDLPAGYTPNQSIFTIGNVETEQVWEEWNIAFKALASNSASPAEPILSYPYQWFADSDQDLTQMRNGSNTEYVAAIPLTNPIAFEPAALGLSATGTLRRRPTDYASVARSTIQSRLWRLTQPVFAGSGLNPDPLISYTRIPLSRTTAPLSGEGHVLFTPPTQGRILTGSASSWRITWQIGGIVTRWGTWIITTRVNTDSTCRCNFFHVNQAANTTYNWRPVLFQGCLSGSTANTISIEFRASYSDYTAASVAETEFLHPNSNIGGTNPNFTRVFDSVQRSTWVLFEEILSY